MSFSKIVVATDGSYNANRAVSLAADLAVKYGAELFVLHSVIEGPVPQSLLQWARVEHLIDEEPPQATDVEWPSYPRLGVIGPEMVPRVSYQARVGLGRAILDHAVQWARDMGAKRITPVLEEGDAAQAVAKLARKEQADLVVLGTRGLGTLEEAVLGSVSHKVISLRLAPCLAVP